MTDICYRIGEWYGWNALRFPRIVRRIIGNRYSHATAYGPLSERRTALWSGVHDGFYARDVSDCE
jgi:hypothetical protein